MQLHQITTIMPLAILLAACSTTPTSVGQRRPVPAQRVHDHSLMSSSPQRSSRLTITRDQGYTGSLTGIDVFLDGHRVARVAIGESITIYATAGEHLVGAKYSWGPVGPAEQAVTLSAVSPKYVRITIDQSGNLGVKPESGLL